MAILRSLDGKFYEVPDDQLDSLLIPEDKVKEKLRDAGPPGGGPGGPPPGGPGWGGGPPVVIQIFGGQAKMRRGRGAQPGQPLANPEVAPYHHGCGGHSGPPWHNCWHNCWRNCHCPG